MGRDVGQQPPASTTLRLRHDDLHWRVMGEEVVVLDLGRSVYLAASSAAAVLWDALAEGTTEAALAAVLVERYGLEAVTAASDVRAFVAALDEHRLLQR